MSIESFFFLFNDLSNFLIPKLMIFTGKILYAFDALNFFIYVCYIWQQQYLPKLIPLLGTTRNQFEGMRFSFRALSMWFLVISLISFKIDFQTKKKITVDEYELKASLKEK